MIYKATQGQKVNFVRGRNLKDIRVIYNFEEDVTKKKKRRITVLNIIEFNYKENDVSCILRTA